MTTYSIRVAINNTEIDCDQIGLIRTAEGGGSFLKEGALPTCSFVYRTDINNAWGVETITIAVEGPYNGTAPAWWHDNGDGTYYHILFHGPIIGYKASAIDSLWTEFSAISEMHGLFQRRARTAASNNSYPRTLTSDIETAHSLTIGNNACIPTFGDGFGQVDRPEQRSASNGEWLRNVMAGTGMSIMAEWEGTLTAPELCWRTDRYWVGGLNHRYVYAGRPWLYQYPNTGFNWQDFVARVEVNGETGNTISHHGWVRYPTLRNMGPRPPTKIIDVSDGTRYYGTARLGNSSMRTRLGNVTAQINSWLDTSTRCQNAAEFLLSHVGEPLYPKMFGVTFLPDQLYADAAADATFVGGPIAQDPEDFGMDHAGILIGDRMISRALNEAFDDSDGMGGDNEWGLWPDHCPVNGDVYDNLYACWQAEIENNSTSSGPTDYYNVRTVQREWTPSGGWKISVDLEPDNTVAIDAGDLDNGTYS